MGGLAAFAANLLRLRMERRWQRRNVAAALAAELGAICDHITEDYVKRLELMDSAKLHHDLYPYYGFRGEKEYMPVFRVLGQSLGHLPRPLPRDLIFWYTTMTVCLERARDLYELTKSQTSAPTRTVFDMTQLQRQEVARLLESAPPLIQRLEQLAEGPWFPPRFRTGAAVTHAHRLVTPPRHANSHAGGSAETRNEELSAGVSSEPGPRLE